MSASGYSHNFMGGLQQNSNFMHSQNPSNATPQLKGASLSKQRSNSRVDACLDEFLSDVVKGNSQNQQQEQPSQIREEDQAALLVEHEPKADVNLAQAFLQRKLARQRQSSAITRGPDSSI